MCEHEDQICSYEPCPCECARCLMCDESDYLDGADHEDDDVDVR